MRESRSIQSLLAELEVQVGTLRREVATHAEREDFHREQKTSGTERLELLEARLEKFKTAATELLEVAGPPAAAPVVDSEDWGTLAHPKVARMVERVLAERPAGAAFGATEVSRAVNQAFSPRLRRAVDARQISVILRRLEARGRLRLARKGKAYGEALYSLP